MPKNFINISHYSFLDLPNPEKTAKDFEDFFSKQVPKARGTVLLAEEGFNLNLCASVEDQLEQKLKIFLESLGCEEFDFHLSYSASCVFKRLKVLVKPEIVALKTEGIKVPLQRGAYAKPAEFAKIVDEHVRLGKDSPWVLVDMRNDFEFNIGTFEGAIPSGTNSFRQFVNSVEKLPKDKKVAMFCTGGIRCEKASSFMKAKGWTDVVHLEGGILTYFSEVGASHWQGGCFVFDDRRVVFPDTLA